MEVSARSETRIYVALAALAILLGPAKFFLDQQVGVATDAQTTAAPALAGLFAGLLLTGIAIARREPMLRRAERVAILVPLLPQLADHLLHAAARSAIPWLRQPGSGDALLLTLAAPLWLGLLAAAQAIQFEVPRITIGATIVAVGAACLTLPLNAYAVAANQLVMLTLQLSLLILTVWTWVFAATRLSRRNVILTAGAFLLLQTALSELPTLFVQGSALQQIDWRRAAVPLLLQSLASAAAMLLWFFLLTRMRLSAFTLHPLAAWLASTLAGLALFGIADWRQDAAFAIGLGALLLGIRARAAEDRPIALELI